MNERRRQNHMGKIGFFRRLFGGLFMSLLVATLVLSPPFVVFNIFRKVSQQDLGLGRQILVTAVCIFILYYILRLLFMIGHRAIFRVKHKHQDPPNMFQESMDALDRIASGDFNVLLEIDDRRYYYKDLNVKINQLAQNLNSMEHMRQEFVSNVSHEIQSPLTSISGFAALLQNEDLPAEERLHYAEIIETESKRLSKLSDNLLKLSMLDSKSKALVVKPFRVDKQLENILLMLEPQWSAKGVEPEVDLEDVTVTGDEDLLSQVWINLLHNAIKFTPEQGKIHLTLRNLDGQAVVILRDTGIGIPEEERLHIFERFYKVDKSRDRSLGGNGLGLSLVQKIVQLHDGSISVESEVGQGTTFTVLLPQENKNQKRS